MMAVCTQYGKILQLGLWTWSVRFVRLSTALSISGNKYRFRSVALAAKPSLTKRVKIQTLCLALVLPSASSPERDFHAN